MLSDHLYPSLSPHFFVSDTCQESRKRLKKPVVLLCCCFFLHRLELVLRYEKMQFVLCIHFCNYFKLGISVLLWLSLFISIMQGCIADTTNRSGRCRHYYSCDFCKKNISGALILTANLQSRMDRIKLFL